MGNPFKTIFKAHHPQLQEGSYFPQDIEYTGEHAKLYELINKWRTMPGELISLPLPQAPADLSKTLTQTVVMSDVAGSEASKELTELTKLKTLSINMNALGGGRHDSVYRSTSLQEPASEQKEKQQIHDNFNGLLQYLEGDNNSSVVVCLQDFPIYMMRTLGPELNKRGYSYYANVYGSNGADGGAMLANVTLINTKVLNGYAINLEGLSITPNYQGTRKVKDETDGHIYYEHGSHKAEMEDIAANYGKGHSDQSTTHNAFQTFNTTISITDKNGAQKRLVIGNGYLSPWSLMVERSKSIGSALHNLTVLGGKGESIEVFMGDTNTYGTDTVEEANIFNLPTHPSLTGPAALLHADKAEDVHIKEVSNRLGYTSSDNNESTIKVMGGLIGMKLDRVMARSSVGEVVVHANPEKVTFTDHHALRASITL